MIEHTSIINKIQAVHRGGRLAAAHLPELIAVTKGQPINRIMEILEAGQLGFAENRVQEAQGKWPELKKRFPEIRLHMIGPLQSNKAAQAVALFDVIETVDREKIALELDKQTRLQQRDVSCFVQVNIGNEAQKTGILPEDTQEFVDFCRKETSLCIRGLMCIPPAHQPPAPYFALMRKLALECGLSELSMGMSGDFETAIRFGATQVRIGTALFGERA